MVNPTEFMQAALNEARRARATGEVPVGAVAVADGKLIGRGRNAVIGRQDPTAHAEILALRTAAAKTGNYRLNGVDLYCTLEPCLMCYSAMVHARIRTLYYGAADPKSGIFSTGVFRQARTVYNHEIEIHAGILEDACSRILKEFFLNRRDAGAAERGGLENR